MEALLRDLLHDLAAEKAAASQNYTHVSYYGEQGKWEVQGANWTPFWDRLCRLSGGEAPPPGLCLGERVRDVMPVVADLTLKYQSSGKGGAWDPFTDSFLSTLVRTYQEVLTELYEVDARRLICCVLESDPWTEGEEEFLECYQIRLQFPFCCIPPAQQIRLVGPRVLAALREINLTGDLDRTPVGDWEENLKHYKPNESVSLYGHTTSPERPPLRLTRIWKEREEDEEDRFEEWENPASYNRVDSLVKLAIDDIFQPAEHDDVRKNMIDEEIFNNEDDQSSPYYSRRWLPLYLSLGYYAAVAKIRPGVDVGKGPIVNSAGSTPREFGRGGETEETELGLAETMLSMVSAERYAYQQSWLDIGRALSNADGGEENGLLSWIRHTERVVQTLPEVPDFLRGRSIPEHCREVYPTLVDSPITVKTMAWYAKMDSKQKYTDWHKKWYWEAMKKAINSASNADVGKALYRVYWLDFVCGNLSARRWYFFKNHRWVESEHGIALRSKISNEFLAIFEGMRTSVSREIEEARGAVKEEKERVVKKIGALLECLKKTAFKGCIMREIEEHFYYSRFESLLDNNPHLTGMLGGVLEVDKEQISFRPGKPEDYIYQCTLNPFRTDLTWESPLVNECMTWLRQCFPVPELLRHFLKFSASCLIGRNAEKIFPIWTGKGNNSKSMIVKLFEATFGPYTMKFPVSLLTGKRTASSNATPELARAKAKRVAFIQEPDDEETMNKALIKGYTGGDTFYARKLHDNGGEIEANFKLVLMCNEIPEIPNADQAVKNRTRVFPFLSTWCADAPDDPAEQMAQRRFKMDPNFEHRIRALAPAFIWIAVQYWPIYAKEGMSDPQIVRDYTAQYWKEHDTYAQFIADNIKLVTRNEDGKPAPDPRYRLTLAEIYHEFKLWYREAYPQGLIPNRAVVKTDLLNRWGKLQDGHWHGVCLFKESPDSAPPLANPPLPQPQQNTMATVSAAPKARNGEDVAQLAQDAKTRAIRQEEKATIPVAL